MTLEENKEINEMFSDYVTEPFEVIDRDTMQVEASRKKTEVFTGQLKMTEELSDNYFDGLQRQMDFSKSLLPMIEKSQEEFFMLSGSLENQLAVPDNCYADNLYR